MNEITRLDFLRHGECEGGHIFRGSNDVPLTHEGLARMRKAIAGRGPWHNVISSPLIRCRALADELATQMPVIFDKRLQEMSFGAWEGRLVEDIWRAEPELIAAWTRDPTTTTPPGGEPLTDVAARVMDCFYDLIDAHCGERLLLICHGGVIRVFLSMLLNMPLSSAGRIHVPYAAFSSVAVYHHDSGNQIKLLGHNWLGEEIDHV